MIVHLFNSSSVSGPERLVLPALASAKEHFVVVNLREERIDHVRESDPIEEYARSLNLEYRDVTVCGRWDSVAVRNLRTLLERLNPDLVHSHDVKASAYLLQVRQDAPSSRFRIVSTHHGVHGRPDWKTRLYESFYRRYILKSFDRVLCVSSADYEVLLLSGLDKTKLRLHLNGIDGHRVDFVNRAGEAQKIRASWLPQEPELANLFLFGVVGRLSAEKDHGRLLQTLSHLNRLPCPQDWKCLVFGSGPLEQKLQLQARQLGLENRVRWMGYRKDVGAEIAGLDLLLSFSKAEGLPINLIEAGLAGTPVMATRVGGVTDLIPEERYGNLIPAHEPAAESALRLQYCLSKEGKAKLQNQAICFQWRVTTEFTQTKWMQRLKTIYAEMDVRYSEAKTRTSTRPRLEEHKNNTLAQRIKSMLFTRLMLYPTSRLGTIRHWNRNGFRILMYHQFPSGHPELQDTLARQCAHIASHYTIVSLTDIARSLNEGIPLPPNALAVTVDDGYRDFLLNGFPVFRAHRIPVTVFLVSGFIDRKLWLWWDEIRYSLEHTPKRSFAISLYAGQDPTEFNLATHDQRDQAGRILIEAMKEVSNTDRLRLLKRLKQLLEIDLPPTLPSALSPLSWDEIRFLAANGIDFGAHTSTHPILSRLKDTAELSAEIVGSKQRIEQELKAPVLHFCYPNGQREDVNDHAFKFLDQGGFQTAVTAERGVNFQGAHPYWLRRIGVDPLMSKFNFEALLAGVGGSRSKRSPYVLAAH